MVEKPEPKTCGRLSASGTPGMRLSRAARGPCPSTSGIDEGQRAQQQAADRRLERIGEPPVVEAILEPVQEPDEADRHQRREHAPGARTAGPPRASSRRSRGTRRRADRPRNTRATVAAVTGDDNHVAQVAQCSSPRMISIEKITPAMGALNVAAMPAAAPQATRLRMRASDRRSHLPEAGTQRRRRPARSALRARPSRRCRCTAPRRATLATTTRGRIAPAAQGDGLHHLGHAVALGLAGEEGDDRPGQQPTQGRDHDEPAAPQAAEGARQGIEQQVADELDEADE